MHLDLQDAIALACLTASALDVKAETPCAVAPGFRLYGLAEEFPYAIEYARVGCGIGARRAADGLLVDVDDLVDMLQPFDSLVFPRLSFGVVQAGSNAFIEDFIHKRAFAGAGNPCHQSQCPQENLDIDILEVVFLCSYHLNTLSIALAPLRRNRNVFLSGKVLTCDGSLCLHDLLYRSLSHHMSAMCSRSGTDIYDMVCCIHGVLIMLHHNKGIAQIPEVLERSKQAVIIPLMQADARLIEYVEDSHKTGADLGRKADALCLSAGQGSRRP